MVVLARGQSGLETGWERAQERWPQGCEEATTAGVRATGGRRRAKGINPDQGRSIYRGGPPDLPVAVPSAIQRTSMALFQKIREKIALDSLPTD
jgi:hypothetical protein